MDSKWLAGVLMSEFSFYGTNTDNLIATFERYVADQQRNLAFESNLKFGVLNVKEAIQVGAVLGAAFDPVETVTTDNFPGPAQIPLGVSGRYENVGNKVAPWGGYSNGTLPLNELKAIGPRPDRKDMYKGFHWLRPDAADAWQQLMTHAKKDGVRLTVTSAYRTKEHQADLAASGGGRAAPAGHSPHGWALAVDIQELYFSGSVASSVAQSAAMRQTPTYKWLDRVGPQYGWHNPASLRDGRGLDESWHWEYYGTERQKK
jgi:hypothetical protein